MRSVCRAVSYLACMYGSLFQELGITLKHIETRPSKTSPESEHDVFVECRCSRDTLPILEGKLKDIVGAVTTHELESECPKVRMTVLRPYQLDLLLHE